jgi:dephospho-CoA kinase
MNFKYATVLTGSIATGKSTVAKIFKGFGFEIIDADGIAHEILDRNYREIEERFGAEYIQNGGVDRTALGGLIFSNPEAKRELESLLHPQIYDEIEMLATKLDRLKRPYLIDIPLFFETKRYPISHSIVVYTPKDKQLKRLIKRNGFSLKEAERRIASQIDIELKRKMGTYVIDNSRDLNSLQRECDRVKSQILSDF